jgi:hypothetical protein
MEHLSALAHFVRHVDPELQNLTAFASGAIAEGAFKDVGSQIVKNMARILGKAINTYKNRNGAQMPNERLAEIPLDASAEFLRKASFIFDDEAQNHWASLLCSFTEDPQRYAKVKFVSILNDLDGTDAMILARIYSLRPADRSSQFETEILTGGLPIEAHWSNATLAGSLGADSMPSSAVQISLENLERLSLIRSSAVWRGPSYSAVYRTRLGSEFSRSLHIGGER